MQNIIKKAFLRDFIFQFNFSASTDALQSGGIWKGNNNPHTSKR